MLSNHIQHVIKAHLPNTATQGQLKLSNIFSEFLTSQSTRTTLVIKGYAGTGKTTMIGCILDALNELKLEAILLAPTGRAAKVISNYTNRVAYTIHRKIYRQRSSTDGFGKFVLGHNVSKDVLFFVDEASMIASQNFESAAFGSGNLLNDLIEYVYQGTNCKLIIIGDTAQLPPVGTNLSPALNVNELNYQNLTTYAVELTEVVRQSAESGILYNATLVRSLIEQNKIEIPKLNLNFTDIVSINGSELIASIQEMYDRYGIEETAIICRSNKRANIYNNGIRQRILFREEQIESGDFLMIVKNNYFWLPSDAEEGFIANGDIIKIKKILKYEERYGYHFATVIIELSDLKSKTVEAKIILETLGVETPSMSHEDNKKLFYAIVDDYAHLSPRKKVYDAVKADPYFNALQVKFAYSVTCHKAQGGQWKAVFVDHGWFTPDMFNVEYLRWLYTAFTRASDKLFLINFNDSFLK